MFVQGVTVIVGSVWLHGCGSGGEFLESESESVEIDRHLSIGCLQTTNSNRFTAKTGEKFCRSDGVTRNNAYCPGSGCCDSSVGCECHTCESTGFTFTVGACTDVPEPSWDWEVVKCPAPAPQPQAGGAQAGGAQAGGAQAGGAQAGGAQAGGAPSEPTPAPTPVPVPTPTCKGNLVWKECGSSCTKTCAERNPVCLTVCQPGCGCPVDAPILKNGRCVAEQKCKTCKKNLVWNECGSSCTKTCAERNPVCPMVCQPGCECPAGKPILKKGRCVAEQKCKTCKKNLVWNECGSSCTKTCAERDPVCPMVCQPGCECPVEKPILKNGRCVAEKKCKKICKFKNKNSKVWCSKLVAKKTGKKSGKKMCTKKSFLRKCSQSCCEAGFLRL